jgi:hypothetical protein
MENLVNVNYNKYHTKKLEYEPLLDDKNRQFTLFPIKYPEIWNEYKKQEKSIWTTEEIDFSQDYKHYEKLDSNKKHVINMILAFFASMDGIVNFNIDENLLKKITINEASNANSTSIIRPDGSNPDWIELHNASASSVNLQGYQLTDDSTKTDKWIFPSVTIAPNGFLTVFALFQM